MTVQDVLSRMDSMEITEWHVFFEMQDAELRRSAKRRGDEPAPVIGDAEGRASVIEAARKAQGLDA